MKAYGVFRQVNRPPSFYRHWDTWCVHYLWHPVMPCEWSRVRNLSSLSTYIISNLINNVKFFFVFLFVHSLGSISIVDFGTHPNLVFVLSWWYSLHWFAVCIWQLDPLKPFLLFSLVNLSIGLHLISHLSYTYSIPQVRGQCQVFSDVFLSVTFPSLSIWRINDGNFLIQRPQRESRRAPNGQFGRITLISLGVRHISCRVCSSISCHHPLYQTDHQAVQTSMTRLAGFLLL